jgi:hypothetical protein
MDTKTRRTLALAAGIPWLVVAGYGYREATVDDGAGWKGPYLIFAVALTVGRPSATAAALLTEHGGRRRLRMAGLVVSGVRVGGPIVAWALPLWMTLLGVGLAMVRGRVRTARAPDCGALAAGQIIGMAALFSGANEVSQADGMAIIRRPVGSH